MEMFNKYLGVFLDYVKLSYEGLALVLLALLLMILPKFSFFIALGVLGVAGWNYYLGWKNKPADE